MRVINARLLHKFAANSFRSVTTTPQRQFMFTSGSSFLRDKLSHFMRVACEISSLIIIDIGLLFCGHQRLDYSQTLGVHK